MGGVILSERVEEFVWEKIFCMLILPDLHRGKWSYLPLTYSLKFCTDTYWCPCHDFSQHLVLSGSLNTTYSFSCVNICTFLWICLWHQLQNQRKSAPEYSSVGCRSSPSNIHDELMKAACGRPFSPSYCLVACQMTMPLSLVLLERDTIRPPQ